MDYKPTNSSSKATENNNNDNYSNNNINNDMHRVQSLPQPPVGLPFQPVYHPHHHHHHHQQYHNVNARYPAHYIPSPSPVQNPFAHQQNTIAKYSQPPSRHFSSYAHTHSHLPAYAPSMATVNNPYMIAQERTSTATTAASSSYLLPSRVSATATPPPWSTEHPSPLIPPFPLPGFTPTPPLPPPSAQSNHSQPEKRQENPSESSVSAPKPRPVHPNQQHQQQQPDIKAPKPIHPAVKPLLRPALISRASEQSVQQYKVSSDQKSEPDVDSPERPSSAPAVLPSSPGTPERGTTPVLDLLNINAQVDNKHISTTNISRHPQTEWVMWVGNVQADATEEELFTFFSTVPPSTHPPTHEQDKSAVQTQLEQKQKRDQIISIFLMAKTNCAFVNYNSKEALVQAVHQFHGTKLRPNTRIRLVCRIKAQEDAGQRQQPSIERVIPREQQIIPGPQGVLASLNPKRIQKFFILKSITHLNLLHSVQHNEWATRVQTQHILDAAFKSADDVFLIFGVNKSGEFFGYARMTSPPNREASLQQGPLTRPSLVPNDSGSSNSSEAFQSGSEYVSNRNEGKLYGIPFRLEWVCTSPLPFTAIRHLRNPWNGGHEVKASRDGTELPPDIGRALIQAWAQYLTTASHA